MNATTYLRNYFIDNKITIEIIGVFNDDFDNSDFLFLEVEQMLNERLSKPYVLGEINDIEDMSAEELALIIIVEDIYGMHVEDETDALIWDENADPKQLCIMRKGMSILDEYCKSIEARYLSLK